MGLMETKIISTKLAQRSAARSVHHMKPYVTSTSRNSISIKWDLGIDQSSEQKEGFELKIKEIYTVQYCVGGDTKRWKTAYRGYKLNHEVKNLAPGYHYNLRVGTIDCKKDKIMWGPVIVGCTKEEPVPVNDIHGAIRKGNLQALRQLINSRIAVVDIYNDQGMSPLMEASAKGDIGAISILLGAGSDVELKSAGVGKTALMIALYHGHIKAAMKLIEAGAQLETKDRRGCTPLHYAVEASDVEAIKFALENGADLEAKDNYGWTPVKRAIIISSSPETLYELLRQGANVNLPPTIHGETEKPTPLMCAVISYQSQKIMFNRIIPLLLQNGAVTTNVNAYGHTATDMAMALAKKRIQNEIHHDARKCQSEGRAMKE